MSDALSATRWKIGLADDHPIMRAALAAALRELDSPHFVESSDASGALSMLDEHPDLDLLLVDLRMPGANGLDTVRALRERAPQVPVVVVSAEENPSHVAALMALGISGYLPKSEPLAVIVSAVRIVLAGGTYVPPRLLAAGAWPDAGVPGLTPRQVEVLRLLAQGLPNKSIASALGVSEGTVKVHLIAVFRALNVRNRTAAVLAAQRYLG
ncbi:Transcriptional regulatory protein DegU [Burkholderiales bacterium]|nr:Transcriptional regulatory protein DegU [Burkholderiales bacterium]